MEKIDIITNDKKLECIINGEKIELKKAMSNWYRIPVNAILPIMQTANICLGSFDITSITYDAERYGPFLPLALMGVLGATIINTILTHDLCADGVKYMTKKIYGKNIN